MIFQKLNYYLFFRLNSFAKKSSFFDRLIIFSATYLIFFLVFFLGVVFASEKLRLFFGIKKADFFVFGLSGIFAWSLSLFIKTIFFTRRPFLEKNAVSLIKKNPESSAFPSGHAAFLFALGSFLLPFHLVFGIFMLCFAFFISLARVISGIHWPLDILGGAVLGFFVALLFLILYF